MLKRMPSDAGQLVMVCVAIAVAVGAVLGLAAISQRGSDNDANAIEVGGITELADLEAYRRRCERLNRTGARARTVYETERRMTRGTSSVVKAAVTLDGSTPPDKILRRRGASEQSGIVVSCSLQARLSAPPREFELSETDWVRRSLLSSDTARWSWHVTPKVGGSHTLILLLRPIVTVNQPGESATEDLSAEDANIQEYETTVEVKVPWDERPAELMSRLAATLKAGEALVTALTALVVALVALGTALGIRGRRRRRASS